jgi:alpha-1,2-mannosyltransferase
MQAAGLVVLAHNSGGPKLDIVTSYEGESTGFLASDILTYASQLEEIFNLKPEQRLAIRTNARASVERFSEEKFETGFLDITSPLVH